MPQNVDSRDPVPDAKQMMRTQTRSLGGNMPRRSETDRKLAREKRAPMRAEPRPRVDPSYATLEELAHAGRADAQYALGLHCAARARPRRAARWYALAASQDLPEAMYALSLCYLRGYGVARSLAASRRWAQRCEQLLSDRSAREQPSSPLASPPLLRATEARRVEVPRIGRARAGRGARQHGEPPTDPATAVEPRVNGRAGCAASNSGNVSPLRLAVSAWL